MRTEDGYIIQECLDGESEAFGVLVDKYKEGIYAFVYAKLRDFHDAQDVTQEVFIHAYRNLRTLRRWESFASWLYRIASRRCKLWIRAASRRIDRDFIQDQDSKVLATYSMGSYRDNQLSESLQECINSLSETYREVLILHYFSGMTIREMSIALGASPTAIGVRLSRARAQLKEEMVAMMDVAFEGQRLPSGFTFRIVEAVKRIDIRPTPRTAGLPWGMSLATGITLIILVIGSHLTFSNPINSSMDWPLPSETTLSEVGQVSVDVSEISQMPVLSGNMGNGYAAEPAPSHQSDMPSLAPSKEEGMFPEEPAARLGKGTVSHVAYSPDGKMLAVSGSLGIWLYDAETLDEIGLLKEYTTGVGQIAFSPDGKLLAAASSDRQVRLWNVRTQKCVGILKGTRVAFSPDGEFVGTTRDENFIRIWNVNTQQIEVWLFEHEDWVECIAFSPDGKTLASGGRDKTIRIWDIAGRFPMAILKGHTRTVTSVAFSPDGKILASAGGWEDGTIRLWSVQDQKQEGVLQGHNRVAYSIAFSPDGELLASGGDGSVKLWDVWEQKQVEELQDANWVESLAFSPDGKTLATASPSALSVHLWDVESGEQLKVSQGYTNEVTGIAFTRDGKTLISTGYGPICFWDVETREQTGQIGGDAGYSIDLSPDETLLASGGFDGNIRLWDVERKSQVGLLQGHAGMLLGVAFSPDGKILASADTSGTARLWDVETGSELGILQHPGWVHHVAFTSDGELLVTSSTTGVFLWDVHEQKQVGFLLHESGASSLAFSPDEKLLASTGGLNIIKLWDFQQREEIGRLYGHTLWAECAAFSPDGSILATGGPELCIWDVNEQKRLALLREHANYVLAVAFSPDGKWLASGSEDGTILFWEVNAGEPGKPVEPATKLPGTWGEVKKTALLQNFPNPFNPETWIPYHLAQDVDVLISIHNAAGRLIRTLKIGQKTAGFYTSKEKAAHWNGKNEAGELVSSGVYFYTIQAGNFTATRKMVVAQ